VRSVQRLLRLLDEDGDGAVSRAEAQSVPGGFARYFPEFDKNKDGRITVEEQRQAEQTQP
jgi:Ca2+-binding EF-hand superfamily protein